MAGIEKIEKYFPLTSLQKQQFQQAAELYTEWNSNVNLISRKDIAFLYEHHFLHSLSIAKLVSFKKGSSVLDAGTGGGFPGIPLAILFPGTHFLLVDSIAKKINIVRDIGEKLKLSNVSTQQARVEALEGVFDFVVSRAVTAFPEFYNWVKGKIKRESIHDLDNGILYLKGGDLTGEIKGFEKITRIFELKNFFDEEFFETKKILYCRVSR